MMFIEWEFLLSELWFLILLAALIGLLAGWIIWGRKAGESRSLSSDLDDCRADLAHCRAEAVNSETAMSLMQSDLDDAQASAGFSKPTLLTGARNGQADDLKKIKGVGPKLEGTLNALGFYHFDQIAKWTIKEVAWVDDSLKFKDRIKREKWVAQAKILAKGGETDFSKRVDKGSVY